MKEFCRRTGLTHSPRGFGVDFSSGQGLDAEVEGLGQRGHEVGHLLHLVEGLVLGIRLVLVGHLPVNSGQQVEQLGAFRARGIVHGGNVQHPAQALNEPGTVVHVAEGEKFLTEKENS